MMAAEQETQTLLSPDEPPPPARENRCCSRVLICLDGYWVHLVDGTPCAATVGEEVLPPG